MNLEIISPDKKLYSGEISLIQLPGSAGSFEVMENHAAMVADLKDGKVKVIDTQKNTQYFDVKGGVVEIKNNKVIVLAE